MKKVFVLWLSILFCFLFSLCSLADSFTAYGSITPSNQNIDNLINWMLNQEDFDLFKDWIGIRTDQNDYSVFYNIENGSAVRLRYYGVQNGYTIDYYYAKSIDNNFNYYPGRFSIVGNVDNSISSSTYNSYFYYLVSKIAVCFILVLFIFFVFRIRKRFRGISL